MRKNNFQLTRRQMIKSSITTGTALVFGFYLPGCTGNSNAEPKILDDGAYVPNAWIRIEKDDQVTILVNHSEMGQGVLTALPMIVADELDADWSKVRSEHAPVADIYKNPMMKIQATGGSTSVRTTWDTLRLAGATVRTMLVHMAALTWQVDAERCRTENSRVYCPVSKKSFRYGELIDAAAELPLPENVTLKQPSEFKLIGQPVSRLDTYLKVDGSAIYGIDVKLPGMLIATVAHPPVIGAEVISVDDLETRQMQGIKQVVRINTGVAVVAETFWHALQGKKKLKITWSKGKADLADSIALRNHWLKLAEQEGDTTYELGDVEDEAANSGKIILADYELPFQAHATQEPMNCTADVRQDGCDLWVPTQNQGGSQAIAALITGLSRDKVKVHTTFLGGGFGRRSEIDFVAEAVEISQSVKKPVKMIWSREEDMTTDFYRPASYNRMKAVIDQNGFPLSWIHRMVGMDHFVQAIPKFIPALVPDWFPGFMKSGAASTAGFFAGTFAAGKGLTGGAGPLPYNIKNVRVEFVEDDIGIPVGFWRAVANSSNGFVVESFIDELAHATGQDPFQYRFRLLQGNPKMRRTLKLAAEKANWSMAAANGAARGIATHDFEDTMISMVAEVTVSEEGAVKVQRIVCAVDCGRIINPKIIKAQLESGVAFGLTATLKSSITFNQGRPEQNNFDGFELLRMDELPVIESYLVESDEPPTGIGEVAVPVVAPAVTNAIFAATGKRIRKLPFSRSDLIGAAQQISEVNKA